MRCLILNAGSGEIPLKINTVSGLPNEAVIESIYIDSHIFLIESDYQKMAEIIAPKLYHLAEESDFILIRCPAIKKNVLKITRLADDVMKDFPKNTCLTHGSELGVWLGDILRKKTNVPVIYSRGIPTSMLPEYATITGHPEIQNACRSHWETVEGTALCIAKTKKIDPANVSFILVMLGSGIGIYGWEKQKIVAYKVRQADGPMSQSSIGGIDALTLMDYFLSKEKIDLRLVRDETSSLLGKIGGLQLYNPEWKDLKLFRKYVETGDNLAVSLFEAGAFQIGARIGEVRASMSDPKANIPVYFYGGGAKWREFVEAIERRLLKGVCKSFGVIDTDPEMEFFINQAKEYALQTQSNI